jgi:lipopolysaccharide export system protein LptC
MTRALWIAVVAALFVAFAWLLQPTAEDAPTPAPGDGADEPDLLMEDTTITQYNEDGSLRYRLAALSIRHFEQDDVTRLDAPALEMHRPPEPPWSLAARTGAIRSEPRADGEREEQVQLEEDVRVERRSGERFVTLTTDALDVWPERRYAATDRAVMIDTNAGRTLAVGLTADLTAGRFRLSSDETQRVHTTVLPSQFRRDAAGTQP